VTESLPPTLSDDDLAAIEARAQAATPGPWQHREQFIETVANKAGNEQLLGITTQRNEEGLDALPGTANACFIAHARVDVERLLNEVRRLRQQNGTP
jgi:hypothetical protein